MREIKFRAFADSEMTRSFVLKDDYKAIGYYAARGFPIMQFTGLHDKNSKEIYEGDIIRSKNHHPEKMEIRFIEGGFCAWCGNDDYPIDINHFYDSKGCCLEVIGNIHDNPELLEAHA